MRNNLSLAFLAILTLLRWDDSLACSCVPGRTLEQHYNHADHVLIAKISGCESRYLDSDGHCDRHRWSFETIERFKGANPVVRPSPDEVVRDTCETSLKVGETYLLFLQDGQTHQCSGTGALSGPLAKHKWRDVQMLRLFRDETIDRIGNPWYFEDSGWYCTIEHQLGTVAHLRFAYQYGSPPQQAANPAQPGGPVLTLVLIQPFEFTSESRLEVDGTPVPLRRVGISVSPNLNIPLETVTGQAASSLLETIGEAAEIRLSGTRGRSYAQPEAFAVMADSTQLPDAVREFKACMDRHPPP